MIHLSSFSVLCTPVSRNYWRFRSILTCLQKRIYHQNIDSSLDLNRNEGEDFCNKESIHFQMEHLPNGIKFSNSGDNYYTSLSEALKAINVTLDQLMHASPMEAKDILKQLFQSFKLSTKDLQALAQFLPYSVDNLKSQQQRIDHLARYGRIKKNAATKQIIQEWLKENSHISFSDPKFKAFAKSLNVSVVALKRYAYYCMQVPGEITLEKKNILREWLSANPSARPDKIQLLELQKATGLAKYQIFNLLTYLSSSPAGQVNEIAKKVIKDWVMKHDRTPTKEERMEIEEKTGLNSYQVRRCIQVFLGSKKEISRADKEFIRRWRIENNYRKATPEERDYLLSKTRLTKYQLTMLLGVKPPIHRQPSQRQPSPLEKKILDEWIAQNGISRTREGILIDVKTASESLQMGHNIILQYFNKLQKQKSAIKITSSSKKILREWVKTHYDFPSQLQKEILAQQTGLSYSQITSQIASIQQKLKFDNVSTDVDPMEKVSKVSPEISLQVREWLEKNKYNLPNKKERTDLLNEFNLTGKQLSDILYNARKKNRQSKSEN